MATRILIADDNEVARATLSELMQAHDHWEVCAQPGNGRQAVLQAIELKPDIIILDLAMPVMDGLAAAREISKILPLVPIVLYTLHKLPSIELEAKKAGIRQVVLKPDTDTLFSVVEELLREEPQETAQGKTELVATTSGPLNLVRTVNIEVQPAESPMSDHSESVQSNPSELPHH
jgi:CheY-like chemotaxis protein